MITRRLSCAYDIYSSFNSMRHTQGSNEWLGSQLRRNERDTNLISNSRRRFPAVIGALIDLKQKPKSFHWILFPSSPKASWVLEFQAISAPCLVRFSIHSVKVVKKLRDLFSESLKLTVHLSPIILRCSLRAILCIKNQTKWEMKDFEHPTQIYMEVGPHEGCSKMSIIEVIT